jgi:glycosyltransferase involved in cell wall biosynthesis
MTEQMRRVLIPAYYFPPIGGIGSIRAARFAECLPEFGWEPLVLAPTGTPHAEDEELDFPAEHVRRAPSLELAHGRRFVPGERAAELNGQPSRSEPTLRARLKQAVHRQVYPDAQIGWYPAAVHAGKRLLRDQQFDAIFSSAYPVTAHLIARTLSRRASLPWVAEFRDPSGFALPLDNAHRARAAALETRIAREASRVVMPTPTWASHFGATWGRDVDVIPNGCDAMPAPAPPRDATVVTHLGTYYPGRQSLEPVWRMVGQLARSNPQAGLRIRFIGAVGDAARAELAAAGVDDLVEATGFVSHTQAAQLVSTSSMLVAAGSVAPDPVSRGWIPAKMFDYLASGLPILYVGAPESDPGQILAQHPESYVVEPGDADGIRAAITNAFDGRTIDRDIEPVTRRARARALAAVLDEAVAAAGR